ncbi:MAG: GNAT family N-acetyltransferase [Oscillospiraceae bacterium]|nr:GNAT family N-acetyltransferase [Oscillospiraceae bacterium]
MQPAKTDGRNRSTANACAPSFHSAAESVALRILTQDSPETARLETINEVSFPECERNAISDLFASGRDGNLDMIGIYAGDALAGFFAVRKFRRIRYLAYFAVAPERRSEGIGSAAIRQLKMLYPDCQIVTEFEAPDPVHEIRRRRRDFYIRNGFYETGWYTFYDETEFQIACSEPELDMPVFRLFLAYLNTIISDHIPQPYQPAPVTERKAGKK